MRVVYSPKHTLHDAEHSVQAGVPGRNWERPARAEVIREALDQDGQFTLEPPTEHGLQPIEAVHAPGLIAFLKEAWHVWRAATVVPGLLIAQGHDVCQLFRCCARPVHSGA
jgi:acetoin utilization deacetylase AcuC-like enzyme